MSNFFSVTLDTTSPSNVNLSLEGGSQYSTSQLITASISTSDSNTLGYQMKLWGDVDTTQDPNIQDTEIGSSWITLNNTKQIKLSAGDGSKTIYVKIRDSVHNVSGQASDNILLDVTLPVVTISGPDVSRISKIPGKNESSFSFQVDSVFDEFIVKVVSSTGASYDTGTQIPTTNGSTNMSGNLGDYPADTPINCTINGTDLESASSGDGEKIIKVFVLDKTSRWSV